MLFFSEIIELITVYNKKDNSNVSVEHGFFTRELKICVFHSRVRHS